MSLGSLISGTRENPQIHKSHGFLALQGSFFGYMAKSSNFVFPNTRHLRELSHTTTICSHVDMGGVTRVVWMTCVTTVNLDSQVISKNR